MTNVFLLTYDHKHGTDSSVHKTFDGAYAQAVKWMRDSVGDWGEDYSNYSDNHLYNSWTDISGETEFFSIGKVLLKE